jgi:pimeloyl-ACP methyl ester carboxylesterase
VRSRRGVAVAVLLIAGVGWLLLRSDEMSVPQAGSSMDGASGVRVVRIMIDSEAVGKRLPLSVAVPAGDTEGRSLLVFLHERGGSDRSWLRAPVLRALAALGTDAPVVAFPAGSEASYWHDRADGGWGRYVTDEVIPRVSRRFRTDGKRVAIGGISMGGFGAYAIALAHPGRFCAVGGHSPALWDDAGDAAPGAFDDAEDFAGHDVIAAARRPGVFGSSAFGPGELSERQYATTDAEDLRQWGERVYAEQGGLLLGELRMAFRGVAASALKGVPVEVVIEWNQDLAYLPADPDASERSGTR